MIFRNRDYILAKIAIHLTHFYSILNLLCFVETITSDTYSKIKCSSDPVMREYLATLEEQKQMEWDSIGNDFEIISYDIPTNANSGCDCAFVCNGSHFCLSIIITNLLVCNL